MAELTLALAQMCCEKGDWAGNLARAETLLAQAQAAGCAVIVFPEATLSGYADYRRFPAAVQPLDSPLVQAAVALTARYGISASFGFLEPNPADPRPLVTQILVAAGRVLGVYRKVHIVDEDVALFSAATATPVFDLPVAGATIPCALAICSDSDRPDLFAAFAGQGARIVFHSAAPGLYGRRTDAAGRQAGYDWYRGHLAQHLGAAARVNGLPIAVAAQTGATVDEDFPGGSCVFGPDGTCLIAAPDWAETLLITTIAV
ncbi:MAG: carbon-nitrogen hydrolase family protein [Chloroflexota bacterium]|nr:carbon-nitrogen hydrolase family protein [Chloroflexota bacterium]